VNEGWGDFAECFDFSHITGIHATRAGEILNFWSLPPSPTILDIGSGTGAFTFLAAKQLQYLADASSSDLASTPSFPRIIAADLSTEMLELLRKKIIQQSTSFPLPLKLEQPQQSLSKQNQQQHSSEYPVVELRQMDAQSLQIPSNSIDLIGCLFTIMFVPDYKKAYSEMHRVLKPGASCALTVWKDIETVRMTDQVGKSLLGKKYVSSGLQILDFAQNPSQIRQDLLDAGFSSVKVIEFSPKFIPESPLSLIPIIVNNPVLMSAFRQSEAMDTLVPKTEKKKINREILLKEKVGDALKTLIRQQYTGIPLVNSSLIIIATK
jgi:ubiquinone/menaquinone biosynthesis C-methylase UbiE